MALIARGISTPFRKGPQGFPQPAEDLVLIKESIKRILLTQRGTRRKRPNFGSDLLRMVFESNNEILADMIRTEINISIGKFEPRVIITDINVVQEDNLVETTINYIVVATEQTDSVIIPITTAI